MPIENGKYVAPTWHNATAPAINATELQAISDTLARLPIANGGTGATTVAEARAALGLGNTTGALPIANGGTGATTVAAARNALGLGNTAGALPIANGGSGMTAVAAYEELTPGWANIRLYKWGPVVMMDFLAISQGNAFNSSGIIPAGYRPVRNQHVAITCYTTGSEHGASTIKCYGNAFIQTNGNLSVQTQDLVQAFPRFSTTWLTA